MAKSNRREPKSLLINPQFQLKFLAVMMGLAFLVNASTYLANYYFFWTFTQKGQLLKLRADHIFFSFLKEQETLMNMVFLFESILIFLLSVTVGLVFSHRIAGPLYKFRKHLESSAKSHRYSKVEFRKKDFFPELADAYNRQIPISKPKSTLKVVPLRAIKERLK